MENSINYFKYENQFKIYEKIQSILLYGEEVEFPLITIAIPTYKRLELLKESLNSALNQLQFSNYEIIVIDNDNDFNNYKILDYIKTLNSSRIRYYKNKENIGMFGNWNRCIELAKGKYITILNDDDWLERDYLIEVSKHINGDKAIFVDTKIKDFRGCKHEKILKENFIRKLLKACYKKISKIKCYRKYRLEDFIYRCRGAGSLGILFNTDSLKKIGGYNVNYFPSSDYVNNANYVYKYGGIKLKKELCNYRIFANESMKLETAKKWPDFDCKFRCFLQKNIYKKEDKKLLEHLKNLQILEINELWKFNENYEKDKIKYRYKLSCFIREKILEIFG